MQVKMKQFSVFVDFLNPDADDPPSPSVGATTAVTTATAAAAAAAAMTARMIENTHFRKNRREASQVVS